ncbi:MAG TPA: MG2 domain-containing protein, partial [Isosphaeraceae bacterium]|nr:MG2 domain-containing protein [Isosphaeraceae bacterium]
GGIALRLDRSYDDARSTLEKVMKADPDGPWTAKLRSELAAVELAAGRFAVAEKMAREQAEHLLDGDRKDRLAGVFQDFADRLLHPDQATTPPDPEGAFALLQQAREQAEGHSLRAKLLLQMGQASQQAGNPARAIENFQAYLNEYPGGDDRNLVRFELAQAQLSAGQALPARLTWTDLVRDLELVDTLEAQRLRARSMYQIAHTYGLPTPPDDASLNLGVAWLRRLLGFAPSHALAVKAAYEIGQSYLARGKSESALDAFREFLAGKSYKVEDAESREQEALFLMQAQFLVGQILQGQEKFQEAIEAWKGYLAKYPDGPQSAEAQRAIVDTQLLIARDHVRRKQYDEARQAYTAFVSQNPLDARVPQVLFEIGQTFAEEKRWKEAISAWETLAGKFPGTEPAAHARYQAAYVEEVELGHPSEAIERYRKVAVEPWASQARQRIAVMEAKSLEVVTPRLYRSGETPALKITTRNLETLTFTAYKVDPEAYFRKKHALSGVESLDIGLVQPDAEWNEPVPGYEKYKPIETTYDLKKLSVPGMYVVKVTDEKNLQATTLVLGSDVDAIFKSSVEQLLVFAQDMKTGKGRPNARVLVSDGEKILLDARTGEDGVLLTDWPEPFSPGRPLQYLVMDGESVAGTGLNIPGQVAQGLSARAYLDTDRPAYRPGQTVELRGVVREVDKGAYTIKEGSKYNLEVYDSRGRRFVDRTQTLSKFGTFHATFPVDPGAPLGTYRIRLFQPGKSDFSSAFEVQAYQLQKIDLTIDLPRTVYFRGETIEADVEARYQYGTPLANRPIEVALPDGRTVRGRTDDSGKYHVSFPTTDFAEEQTFALVARLPEDNVQESVSLRLAVRAFRIDLSTTRSVYLDG